jgi:hypothetical protein
MTYVCLSLFLIAWHNNQDKFQNRSEINLFEDSATDQQWLGSIAPTPNNG